MNIDNLISNLDVEQLNKDCILHSLLRSYKDKKSELSSCDDNQASMLRNQLEGFSDALQRLFNYAKCFPDSCDSCEGLTKCIECIIKDNCIDASIKIGN